MVQSFAHTSKQAVLISLPLLLGYSIGTVFILALLSYFDEPFQSKSGPWELFVSDFLFFRYKFEGFHVPYSDTVHPSAIGSILWVVFVSVIGVALARSFPLWGSSITMHNTPKRDRNRMRTAWKVMLRQKNRMSMKWMCVICGIGFAGAWVGLLIDWIISEIREYRSMHSLTPNLLWTTPRPVVGWFTGVDILWISLVIFAICYFSIIRPARIRIASSRFITKRWCRSCGYPVANIPWHRAGMLARTPRVGCRSCGYPVANIPDTDQVSRCPECGANTHSRLRPEYF